MDRVNVTGFAIVFRWSEEWRCQEGNCCSQGQPDQIEAVQRAEPSANKSTRQASFLLTRSTWRFLN